MTVDAIAEKAISSASIHHSLDIATRPASLPASNLEGAAVAALVLQDGSVYQGISFGANKSVAGECVFQTGMVGYVESLTDPSYCGQVLVLTFPLVGNYGVPSRKHVDALLHDLPAFFESRKIHVAALVVARLSDDYSHYLADSPLSEWLKENDVPGIYGIDTRALTKKIRDKGVMSAKVLNFGAMATVRFKDLKGEVSSQDFTSLFENVPFSDPNIRNLVAEVSTSDVTVYPAELSKLIKNKHGKPMTVLAVDVGMKFNQIRCFTSRGITLKVVPWNFDFNATVDYDGLFISNGPGDPKVMTQVIDRLRIAITSQKTPIFGICLGHQLLALASGAQTKKMKYGNRGHNIPCTDLLSGRCYITSQNHGYEVDLATLQEGWIESFVNANDGSNEGIMHVSLPYFSVQFHPESTPGPRDTEFLFDRFIDTLKRCDSAGQLVSLATPPPAVKCNPVRVDVKKVLVLGSGGLSIGQAGEFDYSGSQAIKALKEEGIYTVLINPNIATIQTSKGLADKVYFLPVNPEFVRKVIQYERPDAIYVSFGGQTALNCAVKMKDEFQEFGVRVLGTPIETVIITEDRELFSQKMAEINEKCARSASATNTAEAIKVAQDIGYPLIIRAAYALGGLGSGFANNEEELVELCGKAFAVSPQILVEKSMKGWKEIEYEVVRDVNDNCITVCNMENFDPLGIHTGDSIVVAPSQTLSDDDYNMLRSTAVNVIRHLGVIGECNIQYALNPDSKEYCIIEVNARLSRSSALASKATGYPLAFVAAKLGLNIPLSELKNSVTKVTCACFEPSLDYVVVKIPRWDLKKFNRVSTKVGSAMKSVGEVMAIGRNFEETIQKAIRSVDNSFSGFKDNSLVADLDEELKNPSDLRLFAIAAALHKGYSVEKIFEMTRIDRWFLNKLKNIVDLDKQISALSENLAPLLLRQAKQLGFSDRHLADLVGTAEIAMRKLRQDAGIVPFVKQIDTVAAEFPSFTNYLYMTYNAVANDVTFEDHGVMVLGSGVYRIGSSVEFDWCAVRTVRTLRSDGFKTIMVNYNPETVSTDYDEADRLYFETITLESVLDIYEIESSKGVCVSMGGQTPNNIALTLHRQNVRIYGTSPEQIDAAENRYKFSRMCDSIGVDQPKWKELTGLDEASEFCQKVGFPVLVRPSYVLSGAAMNVVYSPEDLQNYLQQAVSVSRDYPVVISKFIEDAKEIEMDAIAKDGKLVYHVVSEHIENAGVHSGDATLVLPPQDLEPETVRKIEDATRKIANALNVTGPFNIQFIAKNNEIKVIECNVRASRSFPFVSKVLGVDMIEMATRAMMGIPFEAYPEVKVPSSDYVAVKVAQFSFSRLSGADPVLGVEMASTGEVACFGRDKYSAYLKALLSTGFRLPKKNILLSIGSYKEKQEFLPSVWKLHRQGFSLFATSGTADFISEHGLPVKVLESFDEKTNNLQKAEYSLSQHLANNLIDLYVNLPSRNRYRRPASYISNGYSSRRMAVDFSVPLITNIKCAKLFVEAICRKSATDFSVTSVDYQTLHEFVTFPGGFVDVAMCVSGVAGSLEAASQAAISSGFTCFNVIPSQGATVTDQVAFIKQLSSSSKSICDYQMCLANNSSVDATSDIVDSFKNAPPLLVRFDKSEQLTDVLALSALITDWPLTSKIIAEVTGPALASLLFLASMHKRALHVTNLVKRADLEMISLAKRNGLEVTCDVAVYAMFLTEAQYPVAGGLFGSEEDVAYLWKNLNVIDCFSTNSLPRLLAKHHVGQSDLNEAQFIGVEECLPLLLTAVAEGKLTLQELKERLSINPRRIFDLPEQVDTLVEVEIDRSFVVPREGMSSARCGWSAFAGRKLVGRISRVILKGQVVFVDGAVAESVEACGRPVECVQSKRVRKASIVVPITTTTLAGRSSGSSREQLETTSTTLVGQPIEIISTSAIGKDEEQHMKEVSKLERVIQKVEQIDKNIQLRDLSLERSVPPELLSALRVAFFKQHILSVKQFTRAELHILFNAANEMRTIVERHGSINLLAGKVSCNLFYEPSTRTSSSFESAMVRLGGQVINVNQTTSSVAKGESLSDTVRTCGAYADVVIIRHPQIGSVGSAAKNSAIPVINAGDGIGEHPTQAFLDVYTIREELGTVNGLTITIVGDLKHGRTVHSLVKILQLYDVRLNYVSPVTLKMPEDVKNDLGRHGLPQTEYETLTDELLARTDVLYVTRIQKERFATFEEYEKVQNSYCVTNKTLAKAKETMIVMHPLPRVNEIDVEVDFDPRAAYFRQMRYGLYVRMALLGLVLAK